MGLDAQLLIWINQDWAHPWLDLFFHRVSEKGGFSFPLMALIMLALGLRLGKAGWQAAGAFLLLVVLGDALGNLLKHLLDQPRPCLEMADYLRRWDGRPFSACAESHTGMPSNHALNFFATLVFLGYVLPRWSWRLALLLLAVSVGLSRIYLGSHFPSQVLVGALLGSGWGMLFSWLCWRWLRFTDVIRGQLQKRNHGT